MQTASVIVWSLLEFVSISIFTLGLLLAAAILSGIVS